MLAEPRDRNQERHAVSVHGNDYPRAEIARQTMATPLGERLCVLAAPRRLAAPERLTVGGQVNTTPTAMTGSFTRLLRVARRTTT